MSEDLYRTMVYYDAHHKGGFAKSEAGMGVVVRVSLPFLPRIERLPNNITEMYVYPQLRDYRLRESAQRLRDMEPPEVEAITKFLAKLAAFGQQLLGI